MNEEWRAVVGWEDLYEVSDLGRVRSATRLGTTSFGVRQYGGQLIKPISTTRYLVVNLSGHGGRRQRHVHTLVLEAFRGKRPEGMVACHNDGNPRNAALSNLRWDTQAANCADKLKHGTSQTGERNGNSIAARQRRAAIATAGTA